MREALVEVLTWAAVFEHTLSTEEVHRYLSVNADINDVKSALSSYSEIIFSDGRWHLTISTPNSTILKPKRGPLFNFSMFKLILFLRPIS